MFDIILVNIYKKSMITTRNLKIITFKRKSGILISILKKFSKFTSMESIIIINYAFFPI